MISNSISIKFNSKASDVVRFGQSADSAGVYEENFLLIGLLIVLIKYGGLTCPAASAVLKTVGRVKPMGVGTSARRHICRIGVIGNTEDC